MPRCGSDSCKILGVGDDAERQHELAELGDAAETPGPVRSLAEARDLTSLSRRYDAAVAQLEQRVAVASPNDPSMGYLRALIVLTKKVGLELDGQRESFDRLYRDLEDMHDLVHEIFPGS